MHVWPPVQFLKALFGGNYALMSVGCTTFSHIDLETVSQFPLNIRSDSSARSHEEIRIDFIL